MPVAIKLSRKFYERFGDDIVEEFVGLLNQVDATYKSELHQLFDVYFGRFEAKLAQALAEFRADVDKRISDFRVEVNERFAKLDTRFAQLDAELDTRFAQLDAELDTRFAKLDAELDGKLDKKLSARLETLATKELLEKRLREQTGLFFGAWGILLAGIIALWFR